MHTLSLLLIVIVIGLCGTMLGGQISFLLTALLLTLFGTIAGHGTVGLWIGVLVDERNKMSMARLQMLLWTILVLSGFLTAALFNISHGAANPLAIAVPQELWLLLGISTTSLVGSPLILSTKATEPPVATVPPENAEKQNEEKERTRLALERQGLAEGTMQTQGKVVFWKWPWDARLADLFQGDEIGNAAQLDLGKVQMFLFTFVLVFAYAVMLAHLFCGGDTNKQAPAV